MCHNSKLQMKVVKHTGKVSCKDSIRNNLKTVHRKKLLMVMMWKNR